MSVKSRSEEALERVCRLSSKAVHKDVLEMCEEQVRTGGLVRVPRSEDMMEFAKEEKWEPSRV